MKTYKLLSAIMLLVISSVAVNSQNVAEVFMPTVFWEHNMDKGVILASPKEMEIVDLQGGKLGKILSTELVLNALLSPDGKKMIYTTSTGLWLVKLETGSSLLVVSKGCDYLRWSDNSMNFMFGIYEKKIDAKSSVFSIKLFWADENGGNLKQVYP